jgi:type VI protein secretion system component VasF
VTRLTENQQQGLTIFTTAEQREALQQAIQASQRFSKLLFALLRLPSAPTTNDVRLEALRFKINLISETLKEFQKYFDAQGYQRSSVMQYGLTLVRKRLVTLFTNDRTDFRRVV